MAKSHDKDEEREEDAPPWERDEDESDEDEESEGSSEDDDDEEPEDPADEDEDDEDDEDDDVAPPPARRAARGRTPDDDIPDWLPWVVMIGLIAVGALGAAGFFSPARGQDEEMPEEPAAAAAAEDNKPDSISAQHVLVQYTGSARAGSNITRSKDEAKTRAQEVLKKAKDGADFDKLAAEYSDEPGAKTGFGKLGRFTPEKMVKPFSDAAFQLKVGAVSDLVETPFGYHVIKRTE